MPPRHNRTADTAEAMGYKDMSIVNVSGPNPVLISAINAKRKNVTFFNFSLMTIYIGTQQVTVNAAPAALSSANGIPIAPGGQYTDEDTYDAWYGITYNGALAQLTIVETTFDKE